MTPDAALDLLSTLLRTSLVVSLPVLMACLIAGVTIGVVQTATQINEPSVGYLVKVAAVLMVILAFGPPVAQTAIRYTRECFGGIATVTR